MDSNFTERWIKKFRILTLSLIFSGALNIGLIAAFVAKNMQESEKTFSVLAPKTQDAAEEATNQKLLVSYSHLTFRELSSLLTNTDFVEEGYRKRDLALASLVSLYDFNLEKAIGAKPLQRRMVSIGPDQSIELFPNISDDQYQAILQYAYLERWPLTAHGLFKALQKSPQPRDEALVQSFALTSEFNAVQSLFQKTDAIAPDLLVNLISEGNWQICSTDLSASRRKCRIFRMSAGSGSC